MHSHPTLLTESPTKDACDAFYSRKLVEGARVQSLFNNRQQFTCTIEKVIDYSPEEISADARTRAEAESKRTFLEKAWRAFKGTRINAARPLEPQHYDVRFFSPFRTWTDDDPKLLRKNVPRSRLIGGIPFKDFSILETVRKLERFVQTSWPSPLDRDTGVTTVLNGETQWKSPEGQRKVFATEVLSEPGCSLKFIIAGQSVPCVILGEDTLDISFLDDFMQRGKLWWVP